jgi:hypothetical protein
LTLQFLLLLLLLLLHLHGKSTVMVEQRVFNSPFLRLLSRGDDDVVGQVDDGRVG